MTAPPAIPNTSLTRRGLFGLAAGSALAAASPLAARGFGSGFTHGVASGEPGQSQVLLWTRYAASQDVNLEWQVSTDQGFARIVASGSVLASPDRDFCAKTWAKGLKPGQWYYYRFIAPDGSQSDIGRTRTLPEGSTDKFRMAVFSCSNYGFGWFNAYAHAEQSNDADVAIHLGDYLYEYERGTYPSAEQAHKQRVLWPENEIVVLADYRLRYATYRSDPDLRRIHQSLPMICIWDDHELANDSWRGGARNQGAADGRTDHPDLRVQQHPGYAGHPVLMIHMLHMKWAILPHCSDSIPALKDVRSSSTSAKLFLASNRVRKSSRL